MRLELVGKRRRGEDGDGGEVEVGDGVEVRLVACFYSRDGSALGLDRRKKIEVSNVKSRNKA